MQLEGVYTPVVTPFGDDGAIDFETLTLVIEHQLRGGARGIVSCGTTGEYYACTFDERVALMTHTRDVAQGEAQLFAGCNSGSTREVIRLGEEARGLGYDGLLLSAPHTSLPSQRELAGALCGGRGGRGAADRPLQLPGSRRGGDRLRRARRDRRPTGDRRDQGVERRLLALPHAAPPLRGSRRGHVRLGRSGRRLLLVGRPELARRHGQRASPTARRRARRRAARRPRAGSPPLRGDAAVGAGHGERRVQPEGEARTRATSASPAAMYVSHCSRSTPRPAAENLRLLDEALAVPLPERAAAG